MRLLTTLFRAYPGHTGAMLIALLIGAVAEGIGLSALLPLVSAVGDASRAGEGLAAHTTGPGRLVVSALAAVNLDATIGTLLVVIVLAITVKSALVLVANMQVGYAIAHVATDLRLRMIRALLSARWEYYIGQPIGALANAAATDAGRASLAYFHLATVIALLIQAFVYAVVAFLISWPAALGALAAGLSFFWAVKRLVHIARKAGAKQTRLMRSLLSHLVDSLQSVKSLKAMAREDLAESLLRSEAVGLKRALQREVVSKEALRAFQEPTIAALVAAALYIALTNWSLPVPTMLVLMVVLARVLAEVGRVQRHYQQMVACEGAFWSLERLTREAELESEPPLGGDPPHLDYGIRLDRVGFAYGDVAVLRNASLTVPAGSFTAVVGPSGAGKTTVVDLVTALLRPQEGEIFIDGIPLARIDRQRWRRMIGYVPQDTLLLHDSVLRNVTLGDPHLGPQDAERALQGAGAWTFVKELPNGMETTVGERGAKLSGGQRQRLAIARALVRAPKLLILDEATSALDVDSEADICETLRQLRGTVTILAISHRSAVADAADRVYRIEDGAAVQLSESVAANGSPAGRMAAR